MSQTQLKQILNAEFPASSSKSGLLKNIRNSKELALFVVESIDGLQHGKPIAQLIEEVKAHIQNR